MIRNSILQFIRRATGSQIIMRQIDDLKTRIDGIDDKISAETDTPQVDTPEAPLDARQSIAFEYIKPGTSGIEVGAFASPLAVPPGAHVTYLDRYSPDDLQQEFNIAGLTPKDFGFDSAAVVAPFSARARASISRLGLAAQARAPAVEARQAPVTTRSLPKWSPRGPNTSCRKP